MVKMHFKDLYVLFEWFGTRETWIGLSKTGYLSDSSNKLRKKEVTNSQSYWRLKLFETLLLRFTGYKEVNQRHLCCFICFSGSGILLYVASACCSQHAPLLLLLLMQFAARAGSCMCQWNWSLQVRWGVDMVWDRVAARYSARCQRNAIIHPVLLSICGRSAAFSCKRAAVAAAQASVS